MKTQLRAIFLGVCLGLGSAGVSQAMSELVSISTTSLWPTSATPDGNLVYSVTVGRAGAGLLEVQLTAGAMPPGATVTFEPSVLRFTGHKVTSQTALMTVACKCLTPLDTYPFTITGTARRESITITNQVLLTPYALAIRAPKLMLDGLANGQLRLRGSGAIGKTYQIEASPSLTNPVWTVLGSSTADGNGRFTYFTAQSPGLSERYFRAVTSDSPVWAQ